MCNEPNFTAFLHKKLTREVNALVVRCPQKELGCDWEGELGQLQQHLRAWVTTVAGPYSKNKGCGYVMVACSYQCGAHLQRRKIEEHEMDICPRRPVEVRVVSLTRKYKDITHENQLLRQELAQIKEAHKKEMKRVVHTHKQDLNEVIQACQQQKQELNEMKQTLMQAYQQQKKELDEMKQMHQHKMEESKKMNYHLQRGLEYVQKRCEELRKKQNTLEVKHVTIQSLISHQTHTTTPLPVPPFYFSVINIDHYRKNDYMYNSEPFYSHPGGYKMAVTVYPNGARERKGTHVSLYVGLLHGEFDDHLCWPFDGVITVQAYNRTTNEWSNERRIVMNARECDIRVVSRRMDVLISGKSGYHDYIPLVEFDEDYMKSINVARFRVTSVDFVLICT